MGPSFGADSLVAVAWRDGGVRVLDLTTDRVVSTVRVEGRPNETALSPDGNLLAVSFHAGGAAEDGAVFDVKTGEERFRLSAPTCCSADVFGGGLESRWPIYRRG